MKSGTVPSPRLAWRRLPLLVLGIASLLAGVYGGLTRLPLNLPLPSDNANWLTFHGPLMVCGFLGTVIGLERAVGLPHVWAYAAPLLTGVGAASVIAGVMGRTGSLLLTLGSVAFVVVALRVVQLQRALFTVTMSLGAVCWLIGNVLWLCDWPFPRIVPWWIAFLGLTIVGERLDLSRFQKQVPVARPLFLVSLGVFLAGVVVSAVAQLGGERLMGVGLLALALWLTRFDIARGTVRQTDLPRFMAVCLLAGYGWLAVAGLLIFASSPLQSGSTYDTALHAFFLGFVFSMIFGHAPVIFPSVLNRPVAFRRRFYVHLALLHASLVLRAAGDLVAWTEGRQWGAILNAAALALFLANTVTAMARAKQPPTERAALS